MAQFNQIVAMYRNFTVFLSEVCLPTTSWQLQPVASEGILKVGGGVIGDWSCKAQRASA